MDKDAIIIKTKLDDGRTVYSVSSWVEQSNWQMFIVILAVVIMIGLQIVIAFERFVQDDYESVQYSILPCSEECQAKNHQQLKARQDAWNREHGFVSTNVQEAK